MAFAGTKTNLKVKQTGKPVFKHQSAPVAPVGLISERSRTIPLDYKNLKTTKWINIPSVQGNKILNEDQLLRLYKKNPKKATSVHKTKAEAIKAAKARSKKLKIVKKKKGTK